MEVRLHPYEGDRLTSLQSYEVMGTAGDASLDAITRLAATVCHTSIALVNLVDQDTFWCLSAYGMQPIAGPRSDAVCSDVVAAQAPLAVPDLSGVSRYAGLPFVTSEPALRSYAGVPLVGRDGLPVGTLCVLDATPRTFQPRQLQALSDLAQQVMTSLELRRCDTSNGLAAADIVPEARQPVALRRALDGNEFVPYFQPVVDMRDRRVLGLEALIRWEHPKHGLLAPAAFLPGLEHSSLLQWTGFAVLEAACGLLVDLEDRGIELTGGVAINVSGRQLTRPGLAERVLERLDAYRLPCSALTVELTETAEVSDVRLVHGELTMLREAGVKVVADDFGVGWSNLVRLLQLPLSGIKIDRQLVTGMIGDRVRDHMVASAVMLGATMGLDVIAEGVETELVRHRLLALGCQQGQGWLFSRAVPAAAVPGLLSGQNRLARLLQRVPS